MRLRVIDRLLTREILRFALIALTSVVAIYLLIDLFEELNYFTSRNVSLLNVLRYYLYSLPAAITLLYPVSLVLAVFIVYGQMVRHRELHALESSGVPVIRLFMPAIAIGLATVVVYLVGNELVAIPANARLSDLRRFTIERRAVSTDRTQRDLYFVGEGGRVYFIRELESRGVMRWFSIKQLASDRRVIHRIDGSVAEYRDGVWVGFDVATRTFLADGGERLERHDTLVLDGVRETPLDFTRSPRPVDETQTAELQDYIARMRRAGEDVSEEEVEYHYRFSYALIGLVVILLGLPVSVALRRGGIMFGLGLGLLLSFLYWGAIQLSRAYGTSHIVSPALAAWLPNLVFGAVAVVFLANARR